MQRAIVLGTGLFSALSAACAPGQTQRITFDQFGDGSIVAPTLTDARSGLTLSNLHSASGLFVTDRAGPDSGIDGLAPGVYLTSDGFAPGPGATLAAINGFEGRLAVPAQSISLSFVSTGAASALVKLDGIDALGQIVASSAIDILGADLQSRSVGLASPTPLAGFRVSAMSDDGAVYTAWSAITYTAVPEPACGAMLGAAGLLLRRTRRSSV